MFFVHLLVVLIALFLIVTVLRDLFETVVLPRRVSRKFRLTNLYGRFAWRFYTSLARRISSPARRESTLATFGPLALLSLLCVWVGLLVIAYALLLWGLGSPLLATGGPANLGTDFYFSGTTLLTLGLGDVIPHSASSRLITVAEVATGFGVLALVIGYLPILYQAFSRREVNISLLDAHAGSPPSAGALLNRQPPDRRAKRLAKVLNDWEGWSAELLETHLSYPMLAYYRSQHENQSWVAGLTMILDACALVLACAESLDLDEELTEQAAFTFAMARHSAADLALVFGANEEGRQALNQRLPAEERARLREFLTGCGVKTSSGRSKVEEKLDGLRGLYEPYVADLASYLLMPLPLWAPPASDLDDWQTTADGLTAPSINALASSTYTSSVSV
ncbi:MAG: ion channel [Ktedonobacterales bacterium]